jgi:hypothetical protein
MAYRRQMKVRRPEVEITASFTEAADVDRWMTSYKPKRRATARADRIALLPGQIVAAQTRTLAFSRSNSAFVITPRSRRSASLASWSAGVCGSAASWT